MTYIDYFEVGGCVRDEIIGVKSKDIDYTVVISEPVDDPFRFMVNYFESRGFKIFLETPEYFTIRAQFPKDADKSRRALTADFVLARKEGEYTDGRRPDKVEVGTLMDDLARRDFTMNAIAKASDGSYIDPYNGVADIEGGLIRAVGNPYDRLREDALRAVRALRFSVTKRMFIEKTLAVAMQSPEVLDAVRDKISDERIAIEVSKMFQYDTMDAFRAMSGFEHLAEAIFSGKVSLDATMKQRKK